jgi:hypothetical protein
MQAAQGDSAQEGGKTTVRAPKADHRRKFVDASPSIILHFILYRCSKASTRSLETFPPVHCDHLHSPSGYAGPSQVHEADSHIQPQGISPASEQDLVSRFINTSL